MSFAILSSRATIIYIFSLISSLSKQNEQFTTNCLIYGAGKTGIQLSKIIKDDKTLNFIGFLDDNKNLLNTKINNKYIFSPSNLEKIKSKYKIEVSFISNPFFGCC